MKKISEAIQEIISENPFLEFGLSYRLLNLTQLAKFIEPLIEIRTQKDIRHTAILMNLSRLQKQKERIAPKTEQFHIENISIHSNLATITFSQHEELLNQINAVYNEIRSQNGFWGITQGTNEVAIFFEDRFLSLIQKYIPYKPKYENYNISCIGIRFAEKYFEIPGILYALMQKITLQNINLIEIASTYTEFNFYLDQKDVKLAFETLHDSFLQ